jgi:uncharacterized short protein YbdD (DUF466 family)
MRIEFAALLRRGLHTVRRMAGMPDYAAYVEHRCRHHPGEAMPTEREYYAEYVTARYADSPTRCC